MPATMDRPAEALPTASRVVWQGQSQFVTHMAPELFADAVRGFVRRTTTCSLMDSVS